GTLFTICPGEGFAREQAFARRFFGRRPAQGRRPSSSEASSGREPKGLVCPLTNSESAGAFSQRRVPSRHSVSPFARTSKTRSNDRYPGSVGGRDAKKGSRWARIVESISARINWP